MYATLLFNPFLKYLWILWQYFISNIDSQSLLKKTGLIEKILSLKKTITSILWTFRLVIWFVAKPYPSFIKDTMTHVYAALITSQGPIFISCEIGLQRSTKKSNLKIYKIMCLVLAPCIGWKISLQKIELEQKMKPFQNPIRNDTILKPYLSSFSLSLFANEPLWCAFTSFLHRPHTHF